VLLAALGAYSYLSLRSTLISNRASSLQSDYDAAHEVIARLVATAPTPARARRLCATAPALAGRTVATVVTQATGRTVDVIVYDSSLAATATLPDGATPPLLSTSTLDRVITSRRASSAAVVPAPGGDQLVVAFPIQIAGQVCGIAQLAAPMAPIDAVLGDELVVLGAGGGAVLAAALVIGLVLTTHTLRPLRRLTVTAHELAAGDLKARSRLVPRGDEVGELTHSFDGMADRIEDLFRAQQESETQVRRFIADASHELRTPVTALKGYIDVLRRGAARDPETLESSLDAMSNEAERMRRLVLDLLTLARIDARRAPSIIDIDLSDAITAILDEGVPGAPPRVVRALTSPLIVRADPSALATILRNLVINAATYAPGAAQQWTTSVDGGRARIDAHDDGPGIPAADLPHVFERFYRGEKTRAREEGGSGLGLSIVQGLARAMGGDAAISSVEGKGTTVSVWLPLAAVRD